jgi:hypothetical protein
MTMNEDNERKSPLEIGGHGRDGSGVRCRLPRRRGRVLFFIASLAACGFLTWWLWARFRIRFYFIFIPLIGIGGPIFGRPRRWTGGGWEDGRPGGAGGARKDGQPGDAGCGETGDSRRLLEDRGERDAGPGDESHPGDGAS